MRTTTPGTPWLSVSTGVSLIALSLALVLVAPCQAGVIRQLTDQRTTTFGWRTQTPTIPGMRTSALDDAGSSVFVSASTNQLGGNSFHLYQIFRFDAATGVGQQITSFPKGVSDLPGTLSVSDDGQWLAFVSRSDPAGQNHDASPEVFVMRPDGSGLAQRTSDPAVNAGRVVLAQLSGSANRIAFLSNSNPLGTNASNRFQLFVVNFDGTGLRQLTSMTTSSNWGGIAISDDGQRLVFATAANLTGGNADGSQEIFAIQADGTSLRQITSASGLDSQLPVISGDGTKIAFESTGNFTGGNGDGSSEIFAVNWDGTGMRQLTSTTTPYDGGTSVSITDDGQFVFFTIPVYVGGSFHSRDVWKIRTDGTGLSQITNTFPTLAHEPVVAGGGGRVAFWKRYAGREFYVEPPGELDVMAASGSNLLPLMSTSVSGSEAPAITRDGTRIVFSSNMNPFGTNPDGGYEIFRIESDGSGLAQVTNIPDGSAHNPSIAADRTTIVFDTDADPLGQNTDRSEEVFLIRADGTGLRQLTSGGASASSNVPMISANGAAVVYYTLFNGAYSEIFKVNADGTGLVQLTHAVSTSYDQRIDDTGTWITFKSSANLDGTAPNGTFQIWRIRSDGTNIRRVSTDATTSDWFPDISGSGTRVVYLSNANPLGTNAARRYEIFLWDSTTLLTKQLTFSPAPLGTANGPAISGDGNVVFFSATAPYDEPDPNLYRDLFRVSAAGGPVERIGAQSPSAPFDYHPPRPDMTGSRFVFDGRDEPIDQNPDRSAEIWIADMTKAAQIRIGKTAPTLVSWDYETGPIRYDVLRGNVANLAMGSGSTVTLGSVVCLENDSPDADTAGFEDTLQPSVGQAFFYIYRGSQGLNFGPGSWGQDSGGFERVPGSGACAP